MRINTADVIGVIRTSLGHANVANGIGMFVADPNCGFGKHLKQAMERTGHEVCDDCEWMMGPLAFDAIYAILPEIAKQLVGNLEAFEQNCREQCRAGFCVVMLLDCLPHGDDVVEALGARSLLRVRLDKAGQN